MLDFSLLLGTETRCKRAQTNLYLKEKNTNLATTKFGHEFEE